MNITVDPPTYNVDYPHLPSMFNPTFPHIPVLICSATGYLAAIYSLKWAVAKKYVTWQPTTFATVHNVLLASLSLYMFVESFTLMIQGGAFSSPYAFLSFPNTIAHNHRLQFLMDLFYWSKFWELVDTFIIVLRGRETIFLHLFHHCTTAAACYANRYGALQFGTWTNSLIHIFMYAHFARPISFVRKYLTTLQIVQFVYVMSFMALYIVYTPTRETRNEIIFGYFCYAVYLIFFVKFFVDNYVTKKGATKSSKTHKKAA